MADKKKRVEEIKHAAAVAGKVVHHSTREHHSDSLAGVIRNQKDAGSFMQELRGAINLARKK